MDCRLPSTTELQASGSQAQAASSPQGGARATLANSNRDSSTSETEVQEGAKRSLNLLFPLFKIHELKAVVQLKIVCLYLF